jgi:hypothetical protein
MLKNVLWPRLLGGIPRKYVQVASACTGTGLEKLRHLCEEGKLKVLIDSSWSFDEVLKVSSRAQFIRAGPLLTVPLGLPEDVEQNG